MHLEILFNESFRNDISSFDCDLALGNVERDIKAYANVEINKEVSLYRLRLAQIENCFQFTKELSPDEMKKMLKKYLKYLYRESWIVTSFTNQANELKLKLKELRARYPEQTQLPSEVLKTLGKKQKNLRNWFIANNSIQGVAMIATKGLGVVAESVRAAVMATRLEHAASGFVVASRLAYGTVTTLAMTEKATQLFQFSNSPVRDFASLTQSFEEKAETLPANMQVSVMLVIGGKKMTSHMVLNEIVQCVSPFTCSKRETFVVNKSSQSLFFAYTRCNRQLRDPAARAPSQGLIIYLRFKKNENHSRYRRLQKIALGLIPNVSSVCVFVNEENQHLKSLFDSLFVLAQARVQTRTSLLPKIFAFAVGVNRDTIRQDLLQRLRRGWGSHEVRAVSELSASEVKNAAAALKSDLEYSSPMTKEELLDLLATVVRQSNQTG